MKLEDGLRSFASWEGEWPVWKREGEREFLGYFKTGIVLDFFRCEARSFDSILPP